MPIFPFLGDRMIKKPTSWIGWMTLAGGSLLVLGLVAFWQWAQPPTVPATGRGPGETGLDQCQPDVQLRLFRGCDHQDHPPAHGREHRSLQPNRQPLFGRQQRSVQQRCTDGPVGRRRQRGGSGQRLSSAGGGRRHPDPGGGGRVESQPENPVAFAPEGDFLAFLDVAKNVAFAQDRLPRRAIRPVEVWTAPN